MGTWSGLLPIAERTGLIVPLGRWVMRTSFRQLAIWIARHGDDAPAVLNVNVSARDLRDPGFATAVAALLDEFELSGDRITLEVTETTALEPVSPSPTCAGCASWGSRSPSTTSARAIPR
jgi:diguanylate cyclase